MLQRECAMMVWKRVLKSAPMKRLRGSSGEKVPARHSLTGHERMFGQFCYHGGRRQRLRCLLSGQTAFFQLLGFPSA
jgi:hypothetical protein